MKWLPLLLLLLTGCARFSTTQTDRSYVDDAGHEIREITTVARTTTFFESKSSLASFKASQTDKSQTASVGALNQEASSENAVRLTEAIAAGVVRGLRGLP